MEINLLSPLLSVALAEPGSLEAGVAGEGEAFTQVLSLIGIGTETPSVAPATMIEAGAIGLGKPATVGADGNRLLKEEGSDERLSDDPDAAPLDVDPSLAEFVPSLVGLMIPTLPSQVASFDGASPAQPGASPQMISAPDIPDSAPEIPISGRSRGAADLVGADILNLLKPVKAAAGSPAMPQEVSQVPAEALSALRLEKPSDRTLPGTSGGSGVDIVAPEGSISAGGLPIMPGPGTVTQEMASLAAAGSPAAEPLIERQLNLAQDGEWLDQLARDIARAGAETGSLRFRLNPEHLGSLQVELSQGAAGTSVRLTTDSEAARVILSDAQPRLVAEARSQGLRIAEAHVDLGSQSQSQGGGQQDARAMVPPAYLTTWKPESEEEAPVPRRRSTSERFA